MRGDVYPVMTPGRKQEWQYNIHYFGGDTQTFTLPCISLLFLHMSAVEVHRRIQNTILQTPKKDYTSKLNSAKTNIVSLLRIREDTEDQKEIDTINKQNMYRKLFCLNIILLYY